MTFGEWARVRELFETAMGLPVQERGPFLERECAGVPGLLAEVRSLLEGADEDDYSTLIQALKLIREELK